MQTRTVTEAELDAILASLRVGRVKLARLVEECEVELALQTKLALADLDRVVGRLDGLNQLRRLASR